MTTPIEGEYDNGEMKMTNPIAEGVKLVPELAANHPVWEHVWHDPIRRQTIIAALVAAGEMMGERANE